MNLFMDAQTFDFDFEKSTYSDNFSKRRFLAMFDEPDFVSFKKKYFDIYQIKSSVLFPQ